MAIVKQLYIASCSCGKDSLAMTLELIRRQYPLDMVVFYDSGVEFDAIYRIRDKLKQLCIRHHIQFIELHPEVSFVYSMLDRPVKNRDGSGWHYGYSWCGGRCRWATRHKLDAIRKFKESLGDAEIIDYVGICADEPDRLEKEKRPDKVFPLVDWNWTEENCLDYCWSHGWHWYEHSPTAPGGKVELYEILDRVSCYCCTNKNMKELYNIWRYLPGYWQRLRDLQRRTDRPMKKTKSVFDLEEQFQLKYRTQQEEETQLCLWTM